jgi:hypothetical protein
MDPPSMKDLSKPLVSVHRETDYLGRESNKGENIE